MGRGCLAYKSYRFRDHVLLVARSDHTTGSRNIKPEVVFKVQNELSATGLTANRPADV